MFAPENSLTLSQLNTLIRKALNECFVQSIWIRAEISDVKTYQSGHCYFEFIEKDAGNESILAKAPGRIWANVFRNLKPYFESETGQLFTSGIKVLVRVTIDFHPLYGMSLNVQEIDPSFTLGDMVLKRREILLRLEKNGILAENKRKHLTPNPQRIAIVSSPSAAGYEDFYNQLHHNVGQYSFMTRLFPSLMQGKEVESSMLAALGKIRQHISHFDAVVIIRGGGATSDLNCFDSYPLAEAVATFPITDTISTPDRTMEIGELFMGKTFINTVNDQLYMYHYFNDSIFKIESDNTLKTVGFLDMQNMYFDYDELITVADYQTKKKITEPRALVSNFIDTEKYYMIFYELSNNAASENKRKRLAVYNKTDNKQYPNTIIINKQDTILNIKPTTNIFYSNGNTIISTLDAYQALECKLLPDINEDDNPVLVIHEL